MRNRIKWVDAAKGIGIFLVVLGHLTSVNGLTATVIWAFHMPLFFFLSGLTAKAWSTGSGPLLGRSLKNLAVPYIFFSLISIVLWIISKDISSSTRTCNAQLQQAAYGVAGPENQMQ
jgi:fucose 4-O-acetylase-like acetyltransferase